MCKIIQLNKTETVFFFFLILYFVFLVIIFFAESSAAANNNKIYIRDGGGQGPNFSAGGSPSLGRLMREVTAMVPVESGATRTVYEDWQGFVLCWRERERAGEKGLLFILAWSYWKEGWRVRRSARREGFFFLPPAHTQHSHTHSQTFFFFFVVVVFAVFYFRGTRGGSKERSVVRPH